MFDGLNTFLPKIDIINSGFHVSKNDNNIALCFDYLS